MDFKKQQFSIEVAGQALKLEISDLAGQANAAVLGTYGDTSVLVAATIAKENRSVDYLPLVIDYEEKFYAAGKIIGSRFVRREGRPSEAAILSGRLIDRTLRPLFDQRIRRDIQIIITVLSYDEQNDPDFVALISASAALAISEIPWNGPAAGVRIAKRVDDDEVIINPINSFFLEKPVLFDAFVAGTQDKINMVELGGNQAGEEKVAEGFVKAHREIKKLIEFQKGVVDKIGKSKIKLELAEPSQELRKKVQEFLKDKLEEAIYTREKTDRLDKLGELKIALKKYLAGEEPAESLALADSLFEEEAKKIVRFNIVEFDRRPDGRKPDEIRELYAEVGLFRRLHGSALFARGSTQALAVTTLAAPGAEQLIETMEICGKRRFMLHYNFPPYSTGEIGRMGGPGRREIGHGALAEKALKQIIPSQEEFPYTIRIVSEILSSNGSTSMASVCAGSLSLMDAGVPLKKAVAGISLGLITAPDGRYKFITDIQGLEDYYGDMDFKVAGTADGITAIQTDVKTNGLSQEMIVEILAQAKKARLEILAFMSSIIGEPRKELSSYAPIIMTTDIRPEQIGEVIGPAGKVINNIIAVTGVESIDIEQTGRVFVASRDAAKARVAIQQIEAMTHEFQIGEIIIGKVIKILEFGAIVDLGGGKDGMIHISELKDGFVQKVEDVLSVGDIVKAKIIKAENGRIGLSLKAVKSVK